MLWPFKAGTFTGFRQMEEYSRSHGDAWHDFILEWAIHAPCKLHVLACHTACHLSLSGKSQLAYVLHAHIAGRQPEYCIKQQDSVHASPLKAMGTIYGPQSQGYEDTTYLSSPDIWVRKPDCLCLPYRFLARSQTSLGLDTVILGLLEVLILNHLLKLQTRYFF